jgi:5-methylcytosine-specific restriction endonuclease McrA
MKRVLLLNTDWQPLNFISDQRAIRLSLKGRAEVVSLWENDVFSSPTVDITIPATLRLVNHVKRKWKPPRFRKKVLFNRDAWMCQYCLERLYWHNITIDHVLPRSRGGKTSWFNCVVACKPCNKAKANKTPEEAQMMLFQRPAAPTPLHFWDSTKSSVWHDDWSFYIGKNV